MTALLLSLTLAAAPPLFSNVGNLHHPISRRAPLVQRYFDQGLRFNFAFNHTEAKADFAEAARRDPKCAICLWGEALSLKGDINAPADATSEAEAWKLIEAARAADGSAVEHAYVKALAKRYEPHVSEAQRQKAYADAMGQLARAHLDDADAQALWAEAMLDLRPWDQWTKDGQPQPGTETLVTAIRAALAHFPQHPGLNHFCIHALEASPHPEDALDCARRLAPLEPGAGHLVHMPAHIYMRVGRYHDASLANEHAIAADRAYFARTHRHDLMTRMYAGHDFHFLWASAGMEGNAAEALKAAAGLERFFPDAMLRKMEPEMPGIDLMRAPRLLALVRFGRWKELLATPRPPADFPIDGVLWRYAQGLAHVRTGALDPAARDLAAIDERLPAIPESWMAGPKNGVRAIVTIYRDQLQGELLVAQGHTDDALQALRRAVSGEDALGYDEPPPIYLPSRHLLGAALLDAGRLDEAIAVYKEDLAKNRENGWALFGLWQALERKHDPEAKAAQARFAKAWAHADVKLTRSSF